jgi:hypothetical protein
MPLKNIYIFIVANFVTAVIVVGTSRFKIRILGTENDVVYTILNEIA